jgi:hypothetical protein
MTADIGNDFLPTGVDGLWELRTPWDKMEEACLDGDSAGVCRWLRQEGMDMIAAFIERGCTKADRAKETKRDILEWARAEEQRIREEEQRIRQRPATLPKGMRPWLLECILDRFDDETLVHAATGEFIPEPDPDLVKWAREEELLAQLVSDLERGRVRPGGHRWPRLVFAAGGR